MSLTGDFVTMPLADLCQWLAISQKTGILLLQRGEVVKEIYFVRGKIVASASNDPREYFGQFLLAHGKITEEDLIRAFAKQGETGIKLGRLLVLDGLLTEDEVQKFLRIKAEETIYDLFLWDEGAFKFYTDAQAQENNVAIEMDVTSVLMEGTRRSDEWARIRKVFPSSDAVIRIVPEALTRSIVADPLYNRIIQLLEIPRRISDLCLLFHASDYGVNKTLYDMYHMGILEVVETPAPPPPSEVQTEEQVRALCNQGLKQYNGGRVRGGHPDLQAGPPARAGDAPRPDDGEQGLQGAEGHARLRGVHHRAHPLLAARPQRSERALLHASGELHPEPRERAGQRPVHHPDLPHPGTPGADDLQEAGQGEPRRLPRPDAPPGGLPGEGLNQRNNESTSQRLAGLPSKRWPTSERLAGLPSTGDGRADLRRAQVRGTMMPTSDNGAGTLLLREEGPMDVDRKTFLAAWCGAAAAYAAAGPRIWALGETPADLLFVNGAIVTMDDAKPSASALAVKGGEVLAVGGAEELQAYRGSRMRASST